MGAYTNIDAKVIGSIQGVDYNIEGANVAKAAIQFGEAVMGYVGDEQGRYPFKNDTAKFVLSADLVTLNVVDMDVNGVSMASVTFDTDHDTTMDLIVAALNAITGVEAVLDTDDGDNRTILIRTKGADAAITNQAVTLGASQATITVTYTTAQVLMGVAIRTSNDDGEYPQYCPVNTMIRGVLSTQANAAVSAGNKAYLDNAGDDKGYFNSTGIETPFIFRDNASVAGLVDVQVKEVPALLGYAGRFV